MIVGGALLPLSSVLVPEVGRGRERPAFATIAAMRRAVRELAALNPDLVLLTVPAAERDNVAVRSAERLLARFDEFGEHELEIAVSGAPAVAAGLAAAGRLRIEPSPELPVEAATALYFLRPLPAGCAYLVLETPAAASAAERATLAELGARLAALPALAAPRLAAAVGAELSQRIFPGAPGGYHPDGTRFDAAVQDALARSDLAALEGEAAALAEQAGERALAGLSLLHGLLGPAGAQFQLRSYEAPFGAGLLVATLDRGSAH